LAEFQIGDTVLYSVHGICTVDSLQPRVFGGIKQEYYILKPVYAPESTIYVPAKNQDLMAKIQKVLTAEEILGLICSMPEENSGWIEDETIRKEQYKEILAKGDRVRLVQIIKGLYLHQKEQQTKGRRLHITDERFLKDAEKMLYEEFAYVLQIEKEQVPAFIMDRIGYSNRALTE